MEFDMASVPKTLEQGVLVLSQNAWIYNFKLTRFFLDRIWENIPAEGYTLHECYRKVLKFIRCGLTQLSQSASLACLFQWYPILLALTPEQLSGIPFGVFQPEWPSSLNKFIQDCLALSVSRNLLSSSCLDSDEIGSYVAHTESSQNHSDKDIEHFGGDENIETPKASSEGVCSPNDHFIENIQPVLASDIDGEIRRGMSQKKLHEVCQMTSVIHQVILKSGCNMIVDVGSGLGYLGQVLHSKLGYPVLGLEGKQSHTAGAEKRAIQDSLCSHLHNVTCELQPTEESSHELLSLVTDWFNCHLQNSGTCCHQTDSRSSTSRKVSYKTKCDATAQRYNTNDIKIERSCNTFNSLSTETEVEIQDTNLLEPGSYKISKKDNCSVSHECTCSCLKDETEAIENIDEFTNRGCSDHLQRNVIDTDLNHAECMEGVSNQTVPKDFTDDCPLDCKSNLEICDACKLIGCDTGFNVDQDEHICKQCMKYSSKKQRNELETKQFEENKLLIQRQPRVCMVGLHCCGDLTPTMFKCFRDVECIQSLCCVSCCYHRMKFHESSDEYENFPMSICVKKIMKTVPSWNLGLYGLRLAAQETRARWKGQNYEDHDFHVKNVAYRGLLEVCLQKGKFSLKKASRKLAHQRDFKDFTFYVDAVSKHLCIPDTEEEEVYLKSFREEMKSLQYEYQQYFCYIEPITALQVLLQPVIETLIYLDRKMWLVENGFNCDIVPIFNEFISPRNLALVVVKEE